MARQRDLARHRGRAGGDEPAVDAVAGDADLRAGLRAPRPHGGAQHVVAVAGPLAAGRAHLLLVPSVEPPRALVLGDARGAPLVDVHEPDGGVSLRLDRGDLGLLPRLGAAGLAGPAADGAVRRADAEHDLPGVAPHRADRAPAALDRVGVQHARAPSRAPRDERRLSRSQLRRRAAAVRSPLRHRGRGARRRALPLWAGEPRRARARRPGHGSGALARAARPLSRTCGGRAGGETRSRRR